MELLESLRSHRNTILCCLVTDKIATSLTKKLSNRTRRIIASILIWIILFTFEMIVMALLGNSPAIIFLPTLIASLIPSLSIFIISWSYSFIYKNLEQAIKINAIGINLERELVEWWEKCANLRRQLFTSLVFVLIAIIIIIAFFISGNFPVLEVLNHRFQGLFEVILYTVVIIFWGGQGIYWGWMLPNITKVINKNPLSEMQIYNVNPTKSPLLAAVSNSFSFLALEITAMITLCIVGVFTLQPDINQKFIFSISILLLGYIVSSWTFFYTQFYLSTIVKLAKKATTIRIQQEIESLYNNLSKIKSSDLKKLENLLQLQDFVSKTPNSFVSISAWRNFIGSLLAPTLITLIGLLDWNSLLQSIGSIFK
jgi:hypothetical protein